MKQNALMRRLGEYVLRGPVEATAATFISMLIPLLGWLLAAMVVGLVTLRKNAKEGLVVTLWSALPTVLMAMWGNSLPLLAGVLAGTLLVWVLANVLRATSAWSAVLRVTMVLGIVGTLIAHFIYPPQWWEAYFIRAFKDVLPMQDEATLAAFKDSAHMIAQGMNGMIAISVLLNGLALLLIARGWQAALFYAGGLKQELSQLRLDIPEVVVGGVCVLGTMLGISIFSEITPIVMTCFILVALSVIHSYIAFREYALLLQVAIYSVLFALVVVYPQGLYVLAGVGWLDSLIDVRGKL